MGQTKRAPSREGGVRRSASAPHAETAICGHVQRGSISRGGDIPPKCQSPMTVYPPMYALFPSSSGCDIASVTQCTPNPKRGITPVGLGFLFIFIYNLTGDEFPLRYDSFSNNPSPYEGNTPSSKGPMTRIRYILHNCFSVQVKGSTVRWGGDWRHIRVKTTRLC